MTAVLDWFRRLFRYRRMVIVLPADLHPTGEEIDAMRARAEAFLRGETRVLILTSGAEFYTG